MNISIEEVKYIARLAKLRFTEDEAEKLTREFEAILNYFHSIDKLYLDTVDLNTFDDSKKTAFRADENTEFDDKTKLFRNVKSMHETYIDVPKIVE